MKNKYLLLTGIWIVLITSCVPRNQYKELLAVKDYLEQENEQLKSLQKDNIDLRAKARQQQLDLKKVQQEYDEVRNDFNNLNRNYQDLANRYNQLIEENKNLGKGTAGEKQYWEELLAKKQLELENKEREIQTLRYTLDQKNKRVEELLRLLRNE